MSMATPVVDTNVTVRQRNQGCASKPMRPLHDSITSSEDLDDSDYARKSSIDNWGNPDAAGAMKELIRIKQR